MTRAALAAALVGLALAVALPALHLTAFTTPGALIARWWPAVLVVAGIRGMIRPALWYGRGLPAAIALIGLAMEAGRLAGLPVGPLVLAALLLVAGLRLAGIRRGGGRGGRWWGIAGPVTSTRRLVGDIRLGGPDWRVENSSIFQLAGQVHMDLTDARMPEGTTPLRIGMLAGEVVVTVPPEVGVRAAARLRAGSLELLGHRAEGVSPHLTVESDDFAGAARRIDLTVEMMAGEVRVRRRG